MKETKFKMTEVGVIPADWEIADLNNKTSSAIYGVSASAISYDGKHKYIRITDIDDVTGDFVPKPLVSPSFFQMKHIVHENDLLIARTGATVGKTYVYKKTDGNLIFAGFLMRISIKQANAKYIFFQTQTPYYKKWVISESARTGQPGLNIQQLLSLILPFPPIPEQGRIASVLSNIDTLIGSLDKLIAKKRVIRQGAMQQLLTGKTRLNGFCEKWIDKKLGEVANTSSGGTPYRSINQYYEGNIKWFTTGELNDCLLYDSIEHISKEALSASSAKIFPAYTLLMAMYGATIGKLGILTEPSATNQACCAIFCHDIDINFLFYLLLLNRNSIIEKGSGAGQSNINQNIVKELDLFIPEDKNEQRAIARILTNMDKEIASLQTEKEKYLKIKQGMMQQLLTGKIRLI